jgi:amidase
MKRGIDMSLSDELSYATVSELSRQIRKKQLSSVELLESSIERIEKRNPSLNAFIYFGFDDARKKARECDQKIVSGQWMGPLHGIPTALKDLFDFHPGWISTFGGIRAFQNNVANFHCVYSERMNNAGAVILGKTNSPVLGFRGTCDNYLFGPTKNPFDLSKNSGGSSGGAAAAVADGLLPIAEATDGGGSIRIPAAWCGLYGFKGSFGRVPSIIRPNAFAGTSPFLYEGTVTRTVEDAAIGFQTLSGYDDRDPYAINQEMDFMKALQGSIKGKRIAYSPNFDVFPVDSRITEVIEQALRAFEEAGAIVERVNVGIVRSHMELADLWCRMIVQNSVEFIENNKAMGLDLLKNHRDDFPPEMLKWIECGYGMSVTEMIKDQQSRTEIYDAIQGVFHNYDLLITPTVASLPVDNAEDGNTLGPTEINGEPVNPLIGWCLTYFTNFSGHPSASIPAGLVDNKYPVGMQIIGKRYADDDVITASAQLERARPWQHIYEICKNRPLT